MLYFWVRCLIKSFWDSAFFVGSNKTGISVSIIVALVSISRPISKHVKQHGWSSLKRNWPKVIGEGALLGAGAFLLIWICHLIAAPYGLYTEVEAKNQEAARSCAHEEKQLSGQLGTLSSQLTEIKTDRAVKEGIIQTLERQNRDQQKTVNGCLSQAMTLLSAKPFRMTILKLDLPHIANAWNVLLITNQVVSPVTIKVVCNAPVVRVTSEIIGGGVRLGNDSRLTPDSYETTVSLPPWTPEAPMLVTAEHQGHDEDFSCRFYRQ